MNTSKLRDALDDLEHQQDILSEAATAIKAVIARLDAYSGAINATANIPVVDDTRQDRGFSEIRSYIDETVDLLAVMGRSMHVKEIAAHISKVRGSNVNRASLESSLIRHIAKANQPRIAKTGPSTFGIAGIEEDRTTYARSDRVIERAAVTKPADVPVLDTGG